MRVVSKRIQSRVMPNLVLSLIIPTGFYGVPGFNGREVYNAYLILCDENVFITFQTVKITQDFNY